MGSEKKEKFNTIPLLGWSIYSFFKELIKICVQSELQRGWQYCTDVLVGYFPGEATQHIWAELGAAWELEKTVTLTQFALER